MAMLVGTSVFGIIFVITAVLSFSIFIVILVKILKQWKTNNQSPRLTVDATIVAKRASVSSQHHANAGDITGAQGYSTMSSTTYYATFQVESGDRMELCVPANEYGMLVEGDRGRLSFQGTRFLGFERTS